MKQKIILAACLLFSSFSYAQDLAVQDVPSVVLNSFTKTFPKAQDVEWEKKGDLLNAEFDIGRRDHEVWLNNKGEIVKHKKEIKASELPGAVSSSIKQNFKGYRVDDADQFEEAKQVFYKVELETFTDEKKVVFDKNGKMTDRRL